MSRLGVLLLLCGLLCLWRASYADTTYSIGAGRYDITGPAAEVEMVSGSVVGKWVGSEFC